MQVLFVGNSYTAANDLPGMFADLAKSGGSPVSTVTVQQGGWTLADHTATSPAITAILSRKWDYVILQEQSIVPAVESSRVQLMYPAARLLDAEIRKSGARTVFFLTWGRKDGLPEYGFGDFSSMQAGLTEGYTRIAGELKAMLAPVGPAWQLALSGAERPDLWQSDGSHPSQEGTYLAACVFYATLFQKSPEGLSYDAGLPAGRARLLQSIAAKTVLHP